MCVCACVSVRATLFVVERHALEQPQLRRRVRGKRAETPTERRHMRTSRLRAPRYLIVCLSRATMSSVLLWLPIFMCVEAGARQSVTSPSRRQSHSSSQHQIRALLSSRTAIHPNRRARFVLALLPLSEAFSLAIGSDGREAHDPCESVYLCVVLVWVCLCVGASARCETPADAVVVRSPENVEARG